MNNESMYIWLEDYEEKTEKIEKESWEQLKEQYQVNITE